MALAPLLDAIQAPVLDTARLRLRVPGAQDQAAVLGFLASPRAEFYGGPHTLASAWRVFAAYAGQWLLTGYGFFAVTLRGSGETIGLAGAYHPANFPEPEIAWLLTEARHEGQGYAAEAARAVLADHFARTGAARAVSYIDVANTRSQALARRLGAVMDPAIPAPLPGCETWCHRPGGAA